MVDMIMEKICQNLIRVIILTNTHYKFVIKPPSYVGGFLFKNFFVYLNYDRRYKSYSSQK
jgi:hypothetical protein